jgi:hypothetical protein
LLPNFVACLLKETVKIVVRKPRGDDAAAGFLASLG